MAVPTAGGAILFTATQTPSYALSMKTTFYVNFKLTSDDIPENTSLRRRMMMSKPSYRKTKRFKTLAEAKQFYNQKIEEGKDPRISSCETIEIWKNIEQNNDQTT